MKTLIKKREDYKPLFWIPKKTFLDIYVNEDFAKVKSEILFNKNDFSSSWIKFIIKFIYL